ncbi:MAG: nitrate- and nitrite sensing domain-containing protein [Rhodocyclaceae bacterium]
MQSGGNAFKSELQAARAEADEKIALLSKIGAQEAGLQDIVSLLGARSEHRERTSRLELPVGEATGWYTASIAALLKSVASMSNGAGDASIMRKAATYAMFMEGKERAGQERALLSAVFTAGSFDPARYAKWRELLSAERTFMSMFATYEDEAGRARLKTAMAGEAFAAVDQLRGEAEARLNEKSLGIAADDWFKKATARIDSLHAMEKEIAGDIKNIAVSRTAYVKKILFATIVIGFFVALILAWTSNRVANGVTKMVGGLTGTIQEVARTGDLSKRVSITTNDEAGQAGVAFNTMLEEFQVLFAEATEVMRATSNGQFRPMVAEARGSFNDLKDGVNSAVGKLQQTMNALHEVMSALAAGDFSKRMDSATEGEIRLAVDRAMQAVQTMLGDVGEVMSGVAQGDLTRRVTAHGEGGLARLKGDVNSAIDQLGRTLQAVSQNTQQVASASNETSNAIGQISDGAQNQMHAIDRLSSAVQQTAAAVTEVAKSAESANARAQEMGKTVNEGIADMARMVEIVQSIANNAERIDKITDVIEKIANKTNLLSLNAAIEAARAGEHGKGFAVVAEEVGKLAASAGESTQEIAALVKQAVDDAERATGTVTVVNKGMQEISNGARQTEAELQRISSAMEQQNTAIGEINTNVGSLNRIASANATAADEITSTVIELARLADGTRREVERFST